MASSSRSTARALEFRGEVTSADASLGVAYTIYVLNSSGAWASRVIAATEYVEITYAHLITEVGGRCLISTVTDVAGKRWLAGTYAANGGFSANQDGFVCPKGVTPTLFASAGQVDSEIRGRILGVA